MKILFLLIFCTIFILLSLFLCSLTKNKLSNIITTFFCTLLVITLITKPELCIHSSLVGAELFFYKVFPTMFPFIILSNIIIAYDGINIYSKLLGKILCTPLRLPKQCSLALLISALCGYPLGAKYACELYENQEIDYNTTLRLLNIATNCSPLFIMGTVGVSMLHSSYLGYILLISSYLSCFIMGIILPGGSKVNKSVIGKNTEPKKSNIGIALKTSVENALSSCTLVFGFVIFFSVLIGIIKNTAAFSTVSNNSIISFLILGIIEITNGCHLISLSTLPIELKLVFLSFLTSFSGFCIISQVYVFAGKHNFPLKTYVFRKFIQGVISAIITLLLFKFNFFTSFTFNESNLQSSNNYIFISIFIILLLPFVLYKTIRLLQK